MNCWILITIETIEPGIRRENEFFRSIATIRIQSRRYASLARNAKCVRSSRQGNKTAKFSSSSVTYCRFVAGVNNGLVNRRCEDLARRLISKYPAKINFFASDSWNCVKVVDRWLSASRSRSDRSKNQKLTDQKYCNLNRYCSCFYWLFFCWLLFSGKKNIIVDAVELEAPRWKVTNEFKCFASGQQLRTQLKQVELKFFF